MPDPQDLVDVAAGQATANQRLRVAAYLRNSPRGRHEMQALEEEMAILTKPRRSWLRLPQWIATPLSVAAGLRSTSGQRIQQSFQVANIQAQVTLRVAPSERENWRIEGYVTQNFQPVANAKVTFISERSHPRPRYTDEMGFFVFGRLSEGTCQLRIYLEQGVVVIQDIRLIDEDE